MRFGPEFKQYYTKTLDFHLDGDVGIGDLVYASTYWAQDDRWVNEYSEYMQYLNVRGSAGRLQRHAPAGVRLPHRSLSTARGFSGCKAADPVLRLHRAHRSLVERAAPAIKGRRMVPLAGGRLLGEDARDRSATIMTCRGLQTARPGMAMRRRPTTMIRARCRRSPTIGTATSRASIICSPRSSPTWSSISRQAAASRGSAPCTSSRTSEQLPIRRLLVSAATAVTYGGGSSDKWNSKVGLELQRDGQCRLLYADVAQGFRDGGVNIGLAQQLRRRTASPTQYQPDTLTNYEFGWKTTWLDKHLLWNGAVLLHAVEELQIAGVRSRPSAPPPASTPTSAMPGCTACEIERQVSGELASEHGVIGELQRLARHARDDLRQSKYFEVTPGERLPYVPYFNWSGNVRYEAPVKDALHGTCNTTSRTRATCATICRRTAAMACRVCPAAGLLHHECAFRPQPGRSALD